MIGVEESQTAIGWNDHVERNHRKRGRLRLQALDLNVVEIGRGLSWLKGIRLGVGYFEGSGSAVKDLVIIHVDKVEGNGSLGAFMAGVKQS